MRAEESAARIPRTICACGRRGGHYTMVFIYLGVGRGVLRPRYRRHL